MHDLSLIYTIFNSRDDAISVAESLLKMKLIACANIADPVISLYNWQNEIHQKKEVSVILKTSVHLEDLLITKLKQLHPYECPCITILKGYKTTASFLDWINESCANK
ncbi:MAG: divalent-cation tolerance protein CutA [Proteobacteria bacterium]|nr:divalent-cation tolerance protein CutA [Pseudomonadota bacterium]